MNNELTKEEDFEIENTRPHVVILGAEATIADIPNGDKHGNPCTVMHGFVKNWLQHFLFISPNWSIWDYKR